MDRLCNLTKKMEKIDKTSPKKYYSAQKLSTGKIMKNQSKMIYTLSYTHYPQVFRENVKRFSEKQERLFCGVLIKIAFEVKKTIFLLTNPMSKICK